MNRALEQDVLPAVVMPKGRKIFSRVSCSQDLPVTFSAMWPAME